MKSKIGFLLTAFLMLFSVSANAQSGETPIKGDVNGDGVVDIADINAIIDIMKNGGGTEGESLYYFYVGLEKPTSASNPAANIVGDKQVGWHLIGDTVEGYSLSNPIYNGGYSSQTINVNADYDDVDFYVAIPTETHLHDGLGNELDSGFIIQSNVTIDNHTYNIFKIFNSDFLFVIY